MARIVKPPEERRREIVDAAKKLFIDQGYEKTQISDITDALGVAHGLVYHYFKSKGELFDAVISEIFEESLSSYTKIMRDPSLSPYDKLELAFTITKHQSFDVSPLISAVYSEENTDIRERITKKRIEIFLPLFEHLIIEGCVSDIFDCPHPKQAALFCIYGEMGVKTRYNGEADELYDSIREMYWRVLGIKK